MSHMVTVNVNITNIASLEKAAKTMGFTKQKKAGFDAYFAKSNTLYFGVSKKANGSLEFKTDTYYFKGLDTLKQEYAKEEMLLLAHQRGLHVKSVSKNANGEYQIELIRG